MNMNALITQRTGLSWGQSRFITDGRSVSQLVSPCVRPSCRGSSP